MKKAKIGQSTIEYIIIFAVVIGALIIAANRFFPHVQSSISGLKASIDGKTK